MPNPTDNTMTFSVDPDDSDCVTQDPLQLRILTGPGSGHFDRVVLAADSDNQEVVTLTFDSGDTTALFNPPPPLKVNLAPNPSAPQFASLQPPAVAQIVLHIRPNLGLQHRGTFVDEDPAFARTIRFKTDPQRCGDPDFPDVVVESGT
jgi:hypothetical protein